MIGGGNVFRGRSADDWGIDRVEADSIGMLGTVINAILLRGKLTALSDYDIRVMTAIPINAVAEPYIRLRAINHLVKGKIVILAAGSDNRTSPPTIPPRNEQPSSTPTPSWLPSMARTGSTTRIRTSTPTPDVSARFPTTTCCDEG